LIKIDKPTVAIYGGSFDPPHKAHQQIVNLALKKLDIDYLFVVPTYLNPFKDRYHTPPHTRLKWCQQIFDNPKIKVQDYEIASQKPIPTYQTINHFAKDYDIKYLIIGADNLSQITKWYNFKWLNENITWVVFSRGNHSLDTAPLESYKIIHLDLPISSTDIREGNNWDKIDEKIKNSVIKTLRNQMTIDTRVENIVKVLDDKKAEEIEVFNLDDADYIAKKVVIANSLNPKHTIALYESLKDELKPQGESFLHSDISDDWVVADLGDILIHIMVPEYRQRYSLEEFLNELLQDK
jgi:nicotinate-nucleotide adenylyltransferase